MKLLRFTWSQVYEIETVSIWNRECFQRDKNSSEISTIERSEINNKHYKWWYAVFTDDEKWRRLLWKAIQKSLEERFERIKRLQELKEKYN